MSDDQNTTNHASDEDLLADAIPIPLEEDEASNEDELKAIDIEDADPTGNTKEIRTFGGHVKHEDSWSRSPNVTGQGAIHVKTFVSKLRLDAITHLDQQVNEWLDTHPEYEVKLVTTTIGKLVGKITEEAIFMNVWV